MFYNLFLENYSNEINNIFSRGFFAFFVSFILFAITGNKAIDFMRSWQKEGQPIREDGPQSHLLTKKGTPTMGGLLVLLFFFISVILFCDLSNQYIWVISFVTLGYSVLGFTDDYFKVKKKNTVGVRAKAKLLAQFVIAIIAIFWLQNIHPDADFLKVDVPLFEDLSINLGYAYFIFAAIVIVGSSNGVNMTDGLDGLATVPIMLASTALAIIALVAGNIDLSFFFSLEYIKGTEEIFVLSSALCGSLLGFLWFNANPAKIFMGDVGSLSLGGTLGSIAIIIKHEIVFAVIAGLFVIESLSTIIQVYYFKITKGKRFFLMAPIHHHYEKKGWKEVNVVFRFWIFAFLLAILGVAIAL